MVTVALIDAAGVSLKSSDEIVLFVTLLYVRCSFCEGDVSNISIELWVDNINVTRPVRPHIGFKYTATADITPKDISASALGGHRIP